MFYAPKQKGLKNLAQGFNQVETPGFRHKSESGEYLKSIAYGTNGNRLEAYTTLRRRVAALGPW
jgi:hypothetical protein